MATTITLSSLYGINEGLIMSPSELVELFLYGIPLNDKNGNSLNIDNFSTYIAAAQKEIENYLGISLIKRIEVEKKDYTLNDWKSWGYMRTTFQVKKAYELKGFVNQVQQMDIPIEWLSTKTSNDDIMYRSIHVVPVASSTIQSSSIYHGVVPLGFFMNQNIPNYWNVVYTTGFDKIPMDILNIIGKLASINIFHLMGDLILGSPGIVSKSIGIDGLSQSYSTQSGFKTRIEGYLKDLELTLPRLYNYYKGFTVISL
jgi:hypothetical protein